MAGGASKPAPFKNRRDAAPGKFNAEIEAMWGLRHPANLENRRFSFSPKGSVAAALQSARGYIRTMDIVPPAVRSRMMAAVRTRNTCLERPIFLQMRRWRILFKRHYRHLPGTPDIALPEMRKAIFIDGDFWHGYRYPVWKKRIKSSFWREKIEANRRRDQRNFRKLRRLGWKVLRIWGHEIENDRVKTFDKIYRFLLG
jgi:DNA mismatch endonuclease (patch repair protein)